MRDNKTRFSKKILGIDIIFSNLYSMDQEIKEQIFISRKKTFIDRRQWDIVSYDGGDHEIDQYDDPDSYYIYSIYNRTVTGCVRLRPSSAPTLMTGPLKWLKDPINFSEKETGAIWEASRFFITPSKNENTMSGGGIDIRTLVLFLSMIEFGIERKISHYEVVVDAIMARILRRSGWKLKILNYGEGSLNERIYYGLLPCSTENYDYIKCLVNSHTGSVDATAEPSRLFKSSSSSTLSSLPV